MSRRRKTDRREFETKHPRITQVIIVLGSIIAFLTYLSYTRIVWFGYPVPHKEVWEPFVWYIMWVIFTIVYIELIVKLIRYLIARQKGALGWTPQKKYPDYEWKPPPMPQEKPPPPSDEEREEK